MTNTGTDDPTAPTEVIGARPGRTEYGRIDIDDDVVARIAALTAAEVPDAGSAASRVLGRAPGTRRTVLGAPPKVSAEVDGALVRLSLVLSVRFGASVPAVTAAVRDRVRERVTGLTGLTVTEVDIDVTQLVTRAEPGARTD